MDVTMPDGIVIQGVPDGITKSQLLAKYQKYSPAPKEPKTDMLEAATGAANRMATFGLGDPISAAGIAAIDYARGKGYYGDLYDKALETINARAAAQESQHPIASTVGSGLGFLGSMGMVSPAQGAQVIAPGIKSALKNMAASSRNNAIVSSAIGEANAMANTHGSLDDKLAAAGPAGQASAVVGATLPAVVAGGKGIFEKASAPLLNAITKTNEDRAIQKIAKAFGRDSVTPDEAAAILQNHSPEASLADVGGANVDKLGQVIAATPGKGAAKQADFLLNRNKTFGARLQNLVKTGFSADHEYNATLNGLQDQRAQVASPLYQEAFAKNQNVQSPAIDRILRTPAGQSALKSAAVKMQNDMSLMGVNDPELMEQAQLAGQYVPGQGGIASGLKLRTLDYVKRSLDDQIGAALRGGENDNARILTGMKNNLINALDKSDQTVTKKAPGLYAQARAAYSGPSQSMKALEMGRNFMNEDAQVTINDIADLEPGDRDFFHIGAARAIGDKAAANPNAALRNIVNNDLWKQKLSSAMPSSDDYYNFMQHAQNELNMLQTKNAVLGNSNTAGKLAAMSEDAPAELPINFGNIMDLGSGDWKGTALQLGKAAWNKVTAPSPEIQTEMSKMLYNNNPQQNAATIQAWQKAMQPPSATSLSIPPAANALGYQGAALIGQQQ